MQEAQVQSLAPDDPLTIIKNVPEESPLSTPRCDPNYSPQKKKRNPCFQGSPEALRQDCDPMTHSLAQWLSNLSLHLNYLHSPWLRLSSAQGSLRTSNCHLSQAVPGLSLTPSPSHAIGCPFTKATSFPETQDCPLTLSAMLLILLQPHIPMIISDLSMKILYLSSGDEEFWTHLKKKKAFFIFIEEP